jgi:hypothetical protein
MTTQLSASLSAVAVSAGSARKASDAYIIARRALNRADATWRPMAGSPWTITEARAAYDAGTIELATGRDGDDATLYAIPRRVREIRQAWFGRNGT